jgi:hypothetical protein
MQIRPLFPTLALLLACEGRNTAMPSTYDEVVGNQEEYEFVEDLSREVWIIQGDAMIYGRLDAAGNFMPDWKVDPVKRGRPSSGPGGFVINSPPQKGVYEFRSGRLVPGDIDDKRNFVPTEGGRIIDFKDYHYGAKAPKIYNVPGKFVRKEKKYERK